MIKGLQTGNAALVAAAADQMHANAADVGGNNVPVTGGTYNAEARHHRHRAGRYQSGEHGKPERRSRLYAFWRRAEPDAEIHGQSDAQTNFWANFIAQSNSLGQQAENLVGGNDAHAIAALIANIQTFEKTVTNFDAAQGGIFEARFDNELLGQTSTLGAEVSAMIKGLQTGNAALVTAAAEEMHANAADVGGNNTPATGGTYNADGVTVADVLSTAVAAPAVAAAAPVTPAPAPAAPTAPAAPAVQTVASAPATAADTARGRSASFAGSGDGAALPPHVGITADQRGLRRPVIRRSAGGRPDRSIQTLAPALAV